MKIADRKIAAQEPVTAVPSPSPKATDEGIFTRYVRAIASRSDGVREMVEDLRVELRKALIREMRWRSLWAGSPAYVGILGWSSWTPGDTEGLASPLEDFLSECYLFVFGKQLRRLINQLRVNPKIDGLVVVYIRHFLTDRQKHHDPLGYRLFEILCTAVRSSVVAGDLHVLRGPKLIRNATILSVTPGSDPEVASPVGDLRPLAVRWNDALLPDLVTAERAARRKVTNRLRHFLATVERQGIMVFCFKDLLDALKEDVRVRWSELLHQEDGETVVEEDEGVRRLIRILRPETRVEDLDSFKKLIRCVSNLIPRFDTRKKTRVYLELLWNFLRRWSVGFQQTLPSNRKLEGELGIPRDRYPGLYETLAQLTRRCQGELSGAVVEIDSGRH